MKISTFRTNYIIEEKFQFWFVIIIILAVTIEGTFFGWGMYKLVNIASNWQKTTMVFDFFATLFGILFFIIGINFIIGIYLSHKVAGPIIKIEKALYDIRAGNFHHIQIRRGDLLKDFVREYNETISVLEKLITRDRKLVSMAVKKINECNDMIREDHSAKTIETLTKRFIEIKSYLLAVTSHFAATDSHLKKEDENEK
ncbi:MAG: hypothetical protein JW871_05305 [Endomicrobiales bacterium]|nr:hypothetical protein [Endomicrobiales bacterium]